MPVPGAAAAAITAGGALASGVIGAFSGSNAAKKQLQAVRETNEANKELATLQNQWNLEQWQRETEWQGTPNQLAMWKAAGLNPNFFNGGTVAPTTQSADLANQVAPDVASPYMHIGDSIQRGFDQAIQGLSKLYEIKKLKQETKNLTSQDEYIKASTKEMLLKCGLDESEIAKNKKAVDVMEKNMSALDVQMNLWNAQVNKEDATANEMRLRQKMLRETWDEQKMSYKLQNALLGSEIVKNKADAELIAERFRTQVFETGIKAQEFKISDFNNWLTRIVGSLDVLEKLNAQEKQTFFSTMYGYFTSVLETSSEVDDSHKQYSKRFRSKSDLQGHVLDKIESYSNPNF